MSKQAIERRGRDSWFEAPHFMWALGVLLVAVMLAVVMWIARDRLPDVVWAVPVGVFGFGVYLLARGDQRITGRRIPRGPGEASASE